MKYTAALGVSLGLLISLFLFPLATFASIELVNVSMSGIPGNGGSFPSAITPDGRYVIFGSTASDLVPGDTNGTYDAFLRDRVDHTTSLVSVSMSGGGGVNGSETPSAITPDGRYVLFQSYSSDLVPGDTNGQYDTFTRDTVDHTTKLVSVSMSGGGGNGGSWPTAITPDGRYVLFQSSASDLVPGDTNSETDSFLRDTVDQTTTLVSVAMSGGVGNGYSDAAAITPDGRYVIFGSTASDLVPGDTNGQPDTFIRDTVDHTTNIVSVSMSGGVGNGDSYPIAITPDGRYVIFGSTASDLVPGDTNGLPDTFIRDTVDHTTTLVSVSMSGGGGNGDSSPTAITPDGRYVLFQSYSSDLVPGDTNGTYDAFLRNTATNTTTLVSISMSGGVGNGYSYPTAITPDGRYVLFQSSASDLIPGDTNGQEDAFIRDTVDNTTSFLSVSMSGGVGNGDSYPIAITPDGRYVIVWSSASDLVPGDTNNEYDSFLVDTMPDAPTILSPLSGLVLVSSGVSVSGTGGKNAVIEISLTGVSGTGLVLTGGVLTGMTDNSGNWSFSGISLPEGQYTISVFEHGLIRESDTRDVSFSVDFTPPVVTLSGSSGVTLNLGSPFSDPGAYWYDVIDGSGVILSPFSGSVNTNMTGMYMLEYTYTDRAGYTGNIVSRTVHVLSATGGLSNTGGATMGGNAGVSTGPGGASTQSSLSLSSSSSLTSVPALTPRNISSSGMVHAWNLEPIQSCENIVKYLDDPRLPEYGKSIGILNMDEAGRRLTRAEFLKIVIHALGSTSLVDRKNLVVRSFEDTREKAWYNPYLQYALDTGIIRSNSGENIRFRPNEKITRAEASEIIIRITRASTNTGTENPFIDVGIDNPYKPFIDTAYDFCLVEGRRVIKTGSAIRRYYEPQDSLTLAETLKVLFNREYRFGK